jgi:hypothetical protein
MFKNASTARTASCAYKSITVFYHLPQKSLRSCYSLSMPTQDSSSPVQTGTNGPSFVFWAVVAALVVLMLAWKIGTFDSFLSSSYPALTSAHEETESQPRPNLPGAAQSSMASGDENAATIRDGVYALSGRNSSGTHIDYTGTVQIVRRPDSDHLYDLTWKIASNQTQYGVGILQNGTLSVGYYESGAESADAGAVAYAVVDDSHLEGEWASLKGGDAGIEQLSWLSPPIAY